jgi:hypothetical protein
MTSAIKCRSVFQAWHTPTGILIKEICAISENNFVDDGNQSIIKVD